MDPRSLLKYSIYNVVLDVAPMEETKVFTIRCFPGPIPVPDAYCHYPGTPALEPRRSARLLKPQKAGLVMVVTIAPLLAANITSPHWLVIEKHVAIIIIIHNIRGAGRYILVDTWCRGAGKSSAV